MPSPVLSTLLSVFEQSVPVLVRLLEAELASAGATPVAAAPTLDAAHVAKAQAMASAQLGAIASGLGALKSSVQGVPADTGAIQGQIDQLAASVRDLALTVAGIANG